MFLHAYDFGELKEMFGSGTAAVVSHVADLNYKGEDYPLPPVEDRKIGPMIQKALTDIKENAVEENNGWVKPAVSTILATV